MSFKLIFYYLFPLVFSLKILCAEDFIVWDTFPIQNDSIIIIVDDPAKTVLRTQRNDYSYQIGDILEINDLYSSSSNTIEIKNKYSEEITQAKRLGGLWKKQDGNPFFQLTQIIDWGISLIVIFDAEDWMDRWGAKIYVNQEAFKTDFHLRDNIYIVNSISHEWPTFKEMLFKGEIKDDVWWGSRFTCLINREKGIASQWFIPWDISDIY